MYLEQTVHSRHYFDLYTNSLYVYIDLEIKCESDMHLDNYEYNFGNAVTSFTVHLL